MIDNILDARICICTNTCGQSTGNNSTQYVHLHAPRGHAHASTRTQPQIKPLTTEHMFTFERRLTHLYITIIPLLCIRP